MEWDDRIGAAENKKALRPTLGRKAHFRGTTQIRAEAHTCALITEGDRHVSMEAPGRTKPGVRRSACSRWPTLSAAAFQVIFPFHSS